MTKGTAGRVQRRLAELSELALAESDALANGADNLWLELDKRIEQTLGEKERALGALNLHRKEHGC